MRGLPVLVIIIVLVNVGVRLFKAVSEQNRNNNDDDWDDADNGEWTEWKAGKKPAVPPPPPASRPVTRTKTVTRTVTRSARPAGGGGGAVHRTASAAPDSVRGKLQQVLREVQQAVEQPRPVPPPVAVPAPATATPTKSVFEAEPEPQTQFDMRSAAMQESQPMPEFSGSMAVAGNSIQTAFPDGTGALPLIREREIQVSFKDKRDLRRAVLLREVLDRPRAFDM